MKKIIAPITVLLFIAFTACNNSGNQQKVGGDEKSNTPKTKADSLMQDIMNGHDIGMAKINKIETMQKDVQRVLDSIAKLPAKTKKGLAPYTAKMSEALKELKSAGSRMDQWMENFNMDSEINNVEQRIKYLSEEKLKISSVKETMLNSLHKADSLLKAKF